MLLMSSESPPTGLRIGELGRRLGVSEHLLRAWERRYQLLHPARSASGYRLYSEADERRVRRMQAHLADGMSAAEAARAALSEESELLPAGQVPGPADPGGLADAARALDEFLYPFDEPAAQAALDRLFARYTVETVLRDVIMPYLHRLGERWQEGTVTVADEHLVSNMLRGRLAGFAQGWGRGIGPRAVLACAPGEQHDLPLLAFGIVLHRNGWRVEYLGADTPIDDVARAAAAMSADLAVLSAAIPGRLDPLAADLAGLAAIVPLAIAGAGATQAVADAAGARLLSGDPVTEAELMPAPGDEKFRHQPWARAT
jgi:MerR family transcriptional regulator, light-induced transcriptional regulator